MKLTDGAAATLATLMVASPALADTGSQFPVPFGCGTVVILYICSRQTAEEIGGWLLYYYIQLYPVAFVAAALFLGPVGDQASSGGPVAGARMQPYFIATSMLALLFSLLELVVAEQLRRSRDAVFLRLLRTVLFTELVVGLIHTTLDLRVFRGRFPVGFAALLWPAVWLPYFYRAKRVRRVFPTPPLSAPGMG